MQDLHNLFLARQLLLGNLALAVHMKTMMSQQVIYFTSLRCKTIEQSGVVPLA